MILFNRVVKVDDSKIVVDDDRQNGAWGYMQRNFEYSLQIFE